MDYGKYILYWIVALLLLWLAVSMMGCSSVHVIATDPNDGIVFDVEYSRYLHQEIKGMYFRSPSGYKFGFESQKSPFELGVEFGELKATVGGEGGE